MRFLPITILIVSCGFFENKKANKDPLYFAAQDAGFLKDSFIKADIERFNKKIVSSKYLESLMVGRVSVSVSEIAEYYKNNITQFKRRDEEALVLLFEQQNKNDAIKIKNTIDRNNFDSERVSKTIQKHSPRRVFLEKKSLKAGLADRVFKTTGESFIIQRSDGFVVFYIINIFKTGTAKELVDVSDGIQAKILALKKHALKEKIKDSLYTIYGAD